MQHCKQLQVVTAALVSTNYSYFFVQLCVFYGREDRFLIFYFIFTLHNFLELTPVIEIIVM